MWCRPRLYNSCLHVSTFTYKVRFQSFTFHRLWVTSLWGKKEERSSTCCSLEKCVHALVHLFDSDLILFIKLWELFSCIYLGSCNKQGWTCDSQPQSLSVFKWNLDINFGDKTQLNLWMHNNGYELYT